ncbi:hypothetical protein [Desulfospira joergensenii]|uniref:hypothetical protein n=1 Tax=Desulfospira joergensenii TaxID=53329 RepID=UPI001376B690|nr:hypothetical protein [Desulfospira joergensenii]
MGFAHFKPGISLNEGGIDENQSGCNWQKEKKSDSKFPHERTCLLVFFVMVLNFKKRFMLKTSS